MLTAEQNERLTRTGPGTPMGEAMRRYWIPALLSMELPEPDCPPVRVKLLGEDLVAFRDTSGRIGLLSEFCPHRRASLWLGRNEEDGLRCVYHGWKFDVSGQCVDQMNEPGQFDFSKKVRANSYPVEEMGGLVWAYMGPSESKPPLPDFEWTRVPEEQRTLTKVVQECNWLQALEGGVDTSHAPIMHRRLREGVTLPGTPFQSAFVQGSAPLLELDETDYGYRYFGVRQLGEDRRYVRGYHFIMPFTQLRPPGLGLAEVHGHHWVPIDDESVMVYNWYYAYGDGPLAEEAQDPQVSGNSFTTDIDINDGFRSYRNKSNDWMIDRQTQKTDTFTGIYGINTQDRAVQESMGAIVDREQEHLGQADRAIIVTRRMLQQAIDVVKDGGQPAGTSPTYYDLRAAECTLGADEDWRAALMPLMYPTGNAV
ncbi:MAG: Rieske 2Fe-2S domain-containing protein [Chloroflexi bacterium]|nr:Rieske 2Fe-2S domain-containing protein [Chloroflexota bacterium]MYK34177.1 Rieske 2Fe-2S domain-containing protein [Chloroflexota bacterium]